MSDTTNDGGPGERQAAAEQGEGVGDDLATPSQVDATRTRMQGNGVGQKELNAQRDPTGTVSRDQLAATDEPDTAD
jgi:hypothetical protein